MPENKESVIRLQDLDLDEETSLRISQEILCVSMQELARTNLRNIKLDDIIEDGGFRFGIVISQDLLTQE